MGSARGRSRHECCQPRDHSAGDFPTSNKVHLETFLAHVVVIDSVARDAFGSRTLPLEADTARRGREDGAQCAPPQALSARHLPSRSVSSHSHR